METFSARSFKKRLEKMFNLTNKCPNPDFAPLLKKILEDSPNLLPDQKDEFISYSILKISELYNTLQYYKKIGEIKKFKRMNPNLLKKYIKI
jgi:hypothetical protein